VGNGVGQKHLLRRFLRASNEVVDAYEKQGKAEYPSHTLSGSIRAVPLRLAAAQQFEEKKTPAPENTD
jgi:hypothetical protein